MLRLAVVVHDQNALFFIEKEKLICCHKQVTNVSAFYTEMKLDRHVELKLPMRTWIHSLLPHPYRRVLSLFMYSKSGRID